VVGVLPLPVVPVLLLMLLVTHACRSYCSCCCRALITDHGAFVLFNVYVPNAGDRPERARLPAKLAFLQALQERVDALLGSGRQVG
jgi:exonuclease III